MCLDFFSSNNSSKVFFLAFYLAEKLNLDIIPVFIKGFGKVLPKTSFHLHPGHMSLEVWPRMKRQDIAGTDYRVLTKKIHQMYIDRMP